MNIAITSTAVFHLCITRPILDVLIKLSANHYDSSCKLLYTRAGQGQVNGLLRIWNDTLQLVLVDGESNAKVRATFRDLDILLKCMEMSNWLSADETRLVDGLRCDFLAALRLANAKHDEWTAEYVSPNSTTSAP